ncbi:uncharacterized protein LOC118756232, partial [Rhagoletis pomonella]|uniref:uncharacterized protein LOC118756232 n=1 Tax=Rhagoletis pomonella TaxID=28610 RepID=UPI0017828EFB
MPEFADDVKLLLQVDSLSDCRKLQADLSIFETWCTSNNLYLNTKKCAIVSYTRKLEAFLFDYSLCNNVLNRCSDMKDLGVIFDTKLTFSKHIDFIVSKPFALFGFIRRNTRDFKDPNLVRSRLEYCSLIWNPYYDVYSGKIERVQKVFTKYALYNMIWDDGPPSYTSR